MNRLLACLMLAAAALAQSPAGSVTQTTVTTVVASSPAAASSTQVVCTFTNPSRPAVHLVCAFGGATILTTDATPAVGSTSGFVGTVTQSGNSVTWAIQQPTAGTISWQISANGTSQSGSF